MAQIGTFTKAKNGSFKGKIATLSLSADITIQPATAKSENAPTHRLLSGEVEIGAAWEKTSAAGRTYYTVKMDDPSFAAPITATLTETDTAGTFALIWNRPGSAKHAPVA